MGGVVDKVLDSHMADHCLSAGTGDLKTMLGACTCPLSVSLAAVWQKKKTKTKQNKTWNAGTSFSQSSSVFLILHIESFMVNTCHHTFVKIKNKGESLCKLWNLSMIIYQYWLINCNKCTTVTQDVNNRKKGEWGKGRQYMCILCTFA